MVLKGIAECLIPVICQFSSAYLLFLRQMRSFARNCKFAHLTQYDIQFIPYISALFAQETLFLTQKALFFAQRSPKSA